MKNFIYALLTACALVATFATGGFAATDFSDFEKSLMNEPAKNSAPENASADNAGESADSTNAPTANSADGINEFEQSLMNVPSEMEPIYSIRDQLFNAVKKKDTKTVRQEMEKLNAMQTRSVIPIKNIERECVYNELGMFDDWLEMLVKYYKTVLDTDRYDENPTIAEKDGLSLFVMKSLDAQDTSKTFYSSVATRIQKSKLPDKTRRKLEIMLLLRDAYKDRETGKRVLDQSEEFVEKYPDDPETPWIKHTIIGPLSRMDILDYKLQRRAEFKEDVIQKKLYTGGLGFNFYFLMGGFGLGFDKLYRSDIYEADPLPVNVELYTQFGPAVISLELLNAGVSGLSSIGLGVGFVLFDSRYIKIRPYASVASVSMSVSTNENSLTRGGAFYTLDNEESSDFDGERYIIAANVDFKFITSYLFLSSSKLSSFSLVGKFGGSYLDIDNDLAKGSGFEGFVSLGLGIFFW